jgi:archaemetzincin
VKAAALLGLFLLAAPAAQRVPTPREFWKPLPPAKSGEWRWRHNESPQTLAQYQEAKPVRATKERHTVYLLPALTRPTQEPDRIERMAALMGAYFGRPVRVLPTAALPRKAYNPKRRRISVRECVPYLVKRLPKDAVFLLALTDRDIHLPKSRYNFGWGSLKLRVGICSTWRVDWGKERSLQRRRIYGLALHECTHMLGVPHCTERQCLMNGAMDLRESDPRPMLLCWECRDKVCWNLALDPLKRYDALAKAWRDAGLPKTADRTLLAKKVTIKSGTGLSNAPRK